MDLTRTHYTTTTQMGSIGCDHQWMTSTRVSIGGRTVIDRSCVKCPRFERWLQLARPRSAKRYTFAR